MKINLIFFLKLVQIKQNLKTKCGSTSTNIDIPNNFKKGGLPLLTILTPIALDPSLRVQNIKLVFEQWKIMLMLKP